MRSLWSVFVVLAALPAWAGKALILTAGDCADAALIEASRDFRDSAAPLLPGGVFDARHVLDIVRPLPSRGTEDLERQVESARTLFYGGQNERALDLLERALRELERADPEGRPWKLAESALVLQAQVFKNLDRPRDATEAYRRVLRINPTLKLDAEAWAPSVLKEFEVVRKEVARTKKGNLMVRTDTSATAIVVVDGQQLGTTPLRLELLPGSYHVALLQGRSLSFPHRVEVPKEGTVVNIELSFEGAVSRAPPLCLATDDDGSATKLGQLVGAEKVIVLRNSARGGPAFLLGALYDGSTRQRTGSVTAGLARNLATFLVTGREQDGVRPLGSEPVAKAEPAPAAALVPSPQAESAPPLLASTPPPTPPEEPSRGFFTPGRVVGLVLLGVGAGLATAGIVVLPGGDEDRDGISDRQRLENLRQPDGRFGTSTRTRNEAARLLSLTEVATTSGSALLAGGVGALLGGVLCLLFFPPEAPQVSVAPTAGGAQLSLSGRF